MAKIIKQANKTLIELTDQEAKSLSLTENQFFDLASNSNKVLVFVEQNEKNNLIENKIQVNKNSNKNLSVSSESFSLIDKKIFDLLDSKQPKERVEGRFEKLLSKPEQERLVELLKQGIITIFKKPDFKQGIYSIPKKSNKNNNSSNSDNNTSDANSSSSQKGFFSNGLDFVVFSSNYEAKKASTDFASEIKAGSVKGIRSFEGTYYLTTNDFLDKITVKLMPFLKEKNCSLNDLVEKSDLEKNVVKMACEFLRDSGDLIEKKKEVFALIN